MTEFEVKFSEAQLKNALFTRSGDKTIYLNLSPLARKQFSLLTLKDWCTAIAHEFIHLLIEELEDAQTSHELDNYSHFNKGYWRDGQGI